MKVGRGWENEEIVRDVDEHVYAEKKENGNGNEDKN